MCLAERGFRLAVLTRSAEPFCRAALQKTGLAEYFPYLRSRSSPGPAKPSPEALLLLLEEMGVPPDRALYVGDHQIDAECATPGPRPVLRRFFPRPTEARERSPSIASSPSAPPPSRATSRTSGATSGSPDVGRVAGGAARYR